MDKKQQIFLNKFILAIVIVSLLFTSFSINVGIANAETVKYPGNLDDFDISVDEINHPPIVGDDEWQMFYLEIGKLYAPEDVKQEHKIDYSEELSYIKAHLQIISNDTSIIDPSAIDREYDFEEGTHNGNQILELYILPKKAGNVTLTFRLDGWEKSITLELKDQEPEISILNTGFSPSMKKTAELLLPSGSNASQTQWKSSNEEIATVQADGKMKATITAVSEGKATITATNNTFTATKEIQVWKNGIHKDDKYTEGFTWNVQEGKSTDTLVGYYEGSETKYGTGNYGSWTSSNTSVVTVDKGEITAHSNGTATIYHEPSGQRYECTITVQGMSQSSDPTKGLTPISEPQGSENATIILSSHGAQNQSYNPVYYENYLNQSVKAKKLQFTFSLKSNKTINPLTDDKIPQYEEKNLGYISICKTNGKSIGEKVASYKRGFSLEEKPIYEKNEKHPEKGYEKVTMTLSVDDDVLTPGGDYALVIDKAISGPVDPKKQNVGIGKEAVFFFSTKPFVSAESIVLSQNSATLDVNQSVVLKASIKPTEADETELAWNSSNAKIAKIDEHGKLTGVSPGTAVITVSVEGTAVKAKCSVTVKEKNKVPVGPTKPFVVKAPTKVKAVCTSFDRIKVSWNRADKKTDGYVIYRASTRKGPYKKIKTCSGRAASYTNKSLKTGKTYYYKIKSYQKVNGKTVYSAYSVSKGAKVKPATPKLRATSSKGKITFKWSKAAGTTKYVLYKSTKKNGRYYKTRITTSTKYTDAHVKKGKAYYYKIRAYRTVGGKKIYSNYSKTLKTKVK